MDKTTICDKCKSKVPVNQVKYVPKDENTMMVVCNDCASGKTSKKPAPSTTKIKYFCGRCKYKFKHDPKSLRELQCPFCGKSDRIMDDNTDAASVLQEVSNPSFSDRIY